MMYDKITGYLVESNVAILLDPPQLQDAHGQKVDCVEDVASPIMVDTKITHPHLILVGDEVGSDLCMTGDGHNGGEKTIGKKNTVSYQTATKKSKHFTLMGLTNLAGRAVCCIVIVEGLEFKLDIMTGIDDNISPIDLCNEEEMSIDNLRKYVRKNIGKGKSQPCGPTCLYKGQEVPCIVQFTPKGSMDGHALTNILKHLDALELYTKDRQEGRIPCLLVDGHNSRLSLEFLGYIVNPDHKWTVFFGVPYATSLWQVGDSSEQNGAYKQKINKVKHTILDGRVDRCLGHMELVPTDIIPMVNKAWPVSFGCERTNKKAICDRGWYPYNRNLLNNEDLRMKMTKEDKKNENENILFAHLKEQKQIATIVTPPPPPLPSIHLNVQPGTFSGSCFEHIVRSDDLAAARSEINKKRKLGEKNAIDYKKMKKISTAQIIAHTGEFKLGKSVLDELNRRIDASAEVQRKKQLELDKKYIQKCVKADAVLAAVDLPVNMNTTQLRTVLAPLVVAAKKGIKGDGKMPLTRSGLMERYQQWVVVEKRKRKIVENVEISVADQLANEATEGAGEPVSASDSAPSQDPTDVDDDASVSGRVLLGIDEPIGGSQSSTSVTNGVNDPAEVSF